MRSNVALCLLSALWLGGCTVVGPNYVGQTPEWLQERAAEPAANPVAADGRWWRQLGDDGLAALVDDALVRNHSVRAAGARVLEARAQQAIAGSLLYPQFNQLGADALAVHHREDGGRSGGVTVNSIQYGASATLGWELDFWGKYRRTIEAADAGFDATLAQYDQMQVLVAAQVAELYVRIRTLEQRLDIARQNLDIQRRSLEITERHFKAGNDSELDVQQARTQYLATQSSMPALESALHQTRNALCVLLARPPGELPELAVPTGRVPAPELGLIADIPAQTLLQRPDVRVAERALAAQSAQIGLAEADRYPSISLLGSLGLSTSSLSGAATVFDAGIGPSLKWNVLDWDRLKNAVRIQDARYVAALDNYQNALLAAAAEVDSALHALVKAREQLGISEESAQTAARALEIANIRYREGLSDFSRVLDAQRALFAQQERVTAQRESVALAVVTAYKSLGGGWESGRTRPLVDDATKEDMQLRIDWGDLIDLPLPEAHGGTS
ncbi:TolC family protein [Chitinibacteraceae bacterium HSL-7]